MPQILEMAVEESGDASFDGGRLLFPEGMNNTNLVYAKAFVHFSKLEGSRRTSPQTMFFSDANSRRTVFGTWRKTATRVEKTSSRENGSGRGVATIG